MSEITAREAMVRADAAHDKIAAHEDLCAERYQNIHEKLGTVLKILGWGGSTLFLVLFGLVAFFASRSFDNNDAEVRALRDQIVHMQKAQAPVVTAEIRS